MRRFLNPSNRLALEFNESVKNIIEKMCEPLFNNFSLTVFGYSHFLNNGTYLDLCTHAQWQQHYIEQFASSSFITTYIKQVYERDTQYVLWNNSLDVPREEKYARFIEDSCNHNIWHGFTIYKKHETSVEAWHFATVKENYEIVNFYINRLDLLHHFILYFKDKAGKLIDTTDPDKLIVSEDRSSLNGSDKKPWVEKQIENFMHQTTVQRFSLNTNRGVIIISKREAECMFHLSANKTVKEIARSMELSPRTVESYLDNVKKKSNCTNKSELVSLFTQNSIRYL